MINISLYHCLIVGSVESIDFHIFAKRQWKLTVIFVLYFILFNLVRKINVLIFVRRAHIDHIFYKFKVSFSLTTNS